MWEPGTRVLDGRYRIVAALPRGPLRETYEAEQVASSRRVTLRIFPTPPGSPPAAAPFEAEGQRLATVEHPSVIRVLEAGHAGTTRFLASELSPGPLLADELKGEPLLPERGVELLIQIGHGLAAIHDKGLFHGELTSAAVVLFKASGGETARLFDFGVTRLLEQGTPDSAATVVGQVVGPVDHLAPAQASGARPDVPGDLYAFGVLAYQVLSGVLPARPTPKPLAQAAAHLADQAGLCELVMRCLETDPARRPGSALEVAATLAKLPRPAEPTIFLETMQRPPPVPPSKSLPAAPPPLPPPAAPAPFVASAAGPRPLLASVETLVVPKEAAQQAVAPAPAVSTPRNRLPLVLAGLSVVGLVLGALLVGGGSPAREARKLIEHRQPMQALEILGKAQRKLAAPDPELTALRAAALHLSEAHAEEAAALKSLPADAREAADPLVIGGLAEDFSKKEDPALRTLLRGLPKSRTQSILEGFAQEPLSARQWGALRYLDLEEAAGGLKLVALYAASLESSDCGARKWSARRLGQLMDDAAEPALNRLRDAPREGAEKNCGQDEAQAALLTLRKGR